MNERKIPFISVPLGTFDKGKITAMLGLVLSKISIDEDLVNMSNYQEHLTYTIFLAPTPNDSKNTSIKFDTDNVFININDTTFEQLNHLYSVLENKINQLLTDSTADAQDILNMIIDKAKECKNVAIELYEHQAQAYLTTD